ncbi:aquaporin-like protein [Ramaria rubella]|nr:aquaporin-like protein [Ramaria rubella]
MFLLLGLGGVQSAAFSNQQATQAADSQSGGQSINKVASIEQLTYIAISMGLSLLVSAWLFFRVTGGLFNPAVSTSLLLIGAIGPIRFVLYCIAQLVGGIVASALLLALVPGPLVFNTSPGPSTSLTQAVFIEMFITAALCLAVLMLAAEKHRSTPFAPIGIGLTLLVCHLWAVPYTGAAMNTARAFGPAVITRFNSSHWVYWVGPCLGSLLATAFYAFLKSIKYYRLNPEQDNPQAESPANPVDTITQAIYVASSTPHSSTHQSVAYMNGGENNNIASEHHNKVNENRSV